MDIEQAPPPSESDVAAASVSEALLAHDSRSSIVTAVLSAVMNGSTETLADNLGREWFVCPDIVDSHSTVLIRVTKGTALAYRSISTAVLINPQPAEDAIAALDAELR